MSKTVSQQVGAYGNMQQKGETIRETESRALLNCANRLSLAQKEWGDVDIYDSAIRHNLELWTLFQSTLAESDNPLPRDLKITLLTLSKFIDKRSFQALSEYDPALLTVLIDINRQIAAGLNAQAEQEVSSSTDMSAGVPAASMGTSSSTVSHA
jgi:flagellar biosynthesis activator protein FlaF